MSESGRSESLPASSTAEPPVDGLTDRLQSFGIDSGLPPEPELKLMAMILEDAITCYLRYGNAKSEAARREYRSAARWLFSRDRDWIFSFENICQHLGVDPDFARQRIRGGKLKSSLGRRRNQPDPDQSKSSSRASD